MLLAYLYTREKYDVFAHHIADLCNRAFLFVCNLCKYSWTKGTRKTNIVTLGNIRFRTGRSIHTNPTIFVDTENVSISFVNQKNENDYETLTHHSNDHHLQNPVTICASIYTCVANLHVSSPSTPINRFHNKLLLEVKAVTPEQILESICWAANKLGFERLGYHPHEVGCHSIQSGAAMAIYLKCVPTFTIMLHGRWCSDAFLCYIFKQVK